MRGENKITWCTRRNYISKKWREERGERAVFGGKKGRKALRYRRHFELHLLPSTTTPRENSNLWHNARSLEEGIGIKGKIICLKNVKGTRKVVSLED